MEGVLLREPTTSRVPRFDIFSFSEISTFRRIYAYARQMSPVIAETGNSRGANQNIMVATETGSKTIYIPV